MQSMATNENRNAPPLPIDQALKQIDAFTVLRSSGNQPLLALLKAGSRSGSYYPEYPKEKDWDGLVFCPKAFAGHGRLPASLAPLCIPIVLRPKKPRERVESYWHEFLSMDIWIYGRSASPLLPGSTKTPSSSAI